MSLTPGKRLSAFSIFRAQAPQSMPSTRIFSAPGAAELALSMTVTASPRILGHKTPYGPCSNYRVNPNGLRNPQDRRSGQGDGHQGGDNPLLRACRIARGPRTNRRQLSSLPRRAPQQAQLHSPGARSGLFDRSGANTAQPQRSKTTLL